MINYIRHDEQFYGVCKLSIGDEILGEIIVTEDPETNTDLIFIQHPAKTKIVDVSTPITESAKEQKVAMGFIKWMNFSDEDFYVLGEKDIMTLAPMSPEAVMMYKRWVRKEIQKLPETEREVPMNASMGLLGKVEASRHLLERIYQSRQLPKDQ
jgi:hypothetical protein